MNADDKLGPYEILSPNRGGRDGPTLAPTLAGAAWDVKVRDVLKLLNREGWVLEIRKAATGSFNTAPPRRWRGF